MCFGRGVAHYYNWTVCGGQLCFITTPAFARRAAFVVQNAATHNTFSASVFSKIVPISRYMQYGDHR